MLSYGDIILLGEERVLVIQEHEEGRCWCGETGANKAIAPGVRVVRLEWSPGRYAENVHGAARPPAKRGFGPDY